MASLGRGDRRAVLGRGPESGLYAPVKAFLEGLGYVVKGEIGGCDVVGLRDGEPPVLVIGELKLGFTLELVLQAVDRAPAADELWLAVAYGPANRGRAADSRVRRLCRLLGFGLLAVAANGNVDVLVEPGPWRPRRDLKRRSRLVEEHRRRRGDPAIGGINRVPVMTAYRQRALDCAHALAGGPGRPRELVALAPDAPAILRRNVYGWFVRLSRGLYGLSESGQAALARWPVDAGLPRARTAADEVTIKADE